MCRALHGALARMRPFGGRVFWIDVEERADLVCALEIDTFPVVAIADRDGKLRFAGPVEPRVELLERIVAAAGSQAPRDPGPDWQPILDALPRLSPFLEFPNADD